MKKNKTTTIKKLMTFIGSNKKDVYVAVFFALAGVLFGIMPFVCVSRILIGLYNKTFHLSQIFFWGSATIVSYVLKTLFKALSTAQSHRVAFNVIKNVRQQLSQKIERLPLGKILDESSGTYKVLLVDTTEKLEQPLAHMIPEMASNIIVPIALMMVIFILDYRMGLTLLITILIGLIIMMGQMIGFRKKADRYYSDTENMNTAINEFVKGIKVIITFNRSEHSFEHFVNACRSYRDIVIEWGKSSWGFSATGQAVMGTTLVGVLPVGVLLMMNNEISFSVFMTCIILAIGISGPLLAASSFIDNLANIKKVVDVIWEFLGSEELKRPDESAIVYKGDYVFDNVSFSYVTDKPVLKNIDLKIPHCGVTAIVGKSGSGKSTLAKLLAGLFDPTSGTLSFGSQLIKSIPLKQYMKYVSYVAQDNYLFDISIKENIRMGNISASDDDVMKAAQSSGCHDFIMKLSSGYDTIVGHSGDKLSGGERQRITIARALLKDADIVILDEATAFVDPENEHLIQSALLSLAKGKTLIVVAHRLSTIIKADKIVVMDNGCIECKGTHDDLMNTCQSYIQLWKHYDTTVKENEVTIC